MNRRIQPVLGTTEYDGYDAAVSIDVDRLVETRLVLTAISGGGKSHAIRMMIGKSILDIDVARAMRYLGFQKQSEEKVQRILPV